MIRDDLRSRSARRATFARDLPEAIAAAVVDIRAIASARREILAAYAVLVDRSASADFRQLAQSLAGCAAALGLTLELCGPGPCYSFAAVEEASAEAAGSADRKRDRAHV